MAIVAGFDLETEWLTPVDATKLRIWEWAVVLWDTETNTPMRCESSLIWDEQIKFDSRMKIKEHQLQKWGGQAAGSLTLLRMLLDQADFICAHNGRDFDKIVLKHELERQHVQAVGEKTWIDTMADLPLPVEIETRKLDFLAPSHGFINPFAHRALFDVLSMLKIAGMYDWAVTIKNAQTPDIKIAAETQKPWLDGGKNKDEVKAKGYRWDGEKSLWTKRIKQDQLEKERQESNFRITEII